MFNMMNEARVGVGVQSLGLASQAYLYALDYARERIQGVDVMDMRDPDAPRIPITRHPDVRRMLLHQKAYVEGCRALLYKTAYFADIARDHPDATTRERYFQLIEFLTPICKAYCSDAAFETAVLAVQTMGGYGYISEYPVEQYLRDVKAASIYEGTNGVQALDLLGRKLAKEAGKLFFNVVQELQNFISIHKNHFVLGDLVDKLEKAKNQWQEVVMFLGRLGMEGDRYYPVLQATPFLAFSGNIMLAWMLLEQAIIAHDRLQALYMDNKAHDNEQRSKLRNDNPVATFYYNKIQTAHFFFSTILTRNAWLVEAIRSGDRSSLEWITG